MSGLLACTAKTQFDRFATTKSGGQLLLCAGLFADCLPEVVRVYKLGPDGLYYYYPVLVLLVLILVISFTGIMLALVLGLHNYPADKKKKSETDVESNDNNTPKPAEPGDLPRSLRIMNDTLTVLTALLFILVASKSALLGTGLSPEVAPVTLNKTKN